MRELMILNLSLGTIQQVFKAAKVPIEFDLIENFSMENEEHKKALLKNKNIISCNVGAQGSKFSENKSFYKFLNLQAKGMF